jgi:hypothetical protein
MVLSNEWINHIEAWQRSGLQQAAFVGSSQRILASVNTLVFARKTADKISKKPGTYTAFSGRSSHVAPAARQYLAC